MEVNVKVERLLDAQSFVKKDGTQIVRNSFVGVTTQGNYAKHLKFDVLNQESWQKMQIRVGVAYQISFDIDSREWQGKWYTSLTAWRAVAIDAVDKPVHVQPQNQAGQSPVSSAAPYTVAAPKVESGASNQPAADLPF